MNLLEVIPWLLIIVYLSMVTLLIVDAKRKSVETFIWSPKEEDYSGLKVYEHNAIPYKFKCGGQILLIKSRHNLYNVCLYNDVEWKKRFNKFRKNKKCKDRIKEIITPSECFKIELLVPEGIPNQVITFENEAYMRCSIPIQYNGRYGDITITCQYQLTCKAIIYFLFLGIIKYKEK